MGKIKNICIVLFKNERAGSDEQEIILVGGILDIHVLYAYWILIFCDEEVEAKNGKKKNNKYNNCKIYGVFLLPAFLLLQRVLQFPFDGFKQQYNLIDSIGQAHCEVNGHHCVPYFTDCLKKLK